MNNATTVDAEFDKVAQLGDALLQQINAVREAGPVVWSNVAKAWIVARHQDIVDAYSGNLPVSNVRFHPPFSRFTPEEKQAKFPETMRSIGHWPVFIDPPVHTRVRKLLTRAFGKKVVEDLRPMVRANIARILDAAGEKRDVEFVNDVARAITARTILHLLGMGEEHIGRLERWSYVMNTALGSVSPPLEVLLELEDTVAAMRKLFDAEIEQRRAQPGEDFLSQMVDSREGDDRLSNDEIVGVCITVLIAGHDTTMNSMSLAAIALSKDAAAREHLLTHPETLLNSVMEIARYIAMSTMQNRVVSEDFTWHGQQLKKGDAVFLMLAGGNRDPRVFSEPEKIDMTRNVDQVLVFGTGIHHCIGHLLAKMQLSEFLPELFRRFDVTVKEVEFGPVLSQRGPVKVWAHLEPRPAH